MFLTHMALNPQRRSTRDLVSSPQRLHAAVLSAFVPGTGERGRASVDESCGAWTLPSITCSTSTS